MQAESLILGSNPRGGGVTKRNALRPPFPAITLTESRHSVYLLDAVGLAATMWPIGLAWRPRDATESPGGRLCAVAVSATPMRSCAVI